ncbi:MAG: hypothetical protein Q9228_003040, partial [Teloschistes exilis]
VAESAEGFQGPRADGVDEVLDGGEFADDVGDAGALEIGEFVDNCLGGDFCRRA